MTHFCHRLDHAFFTCCLNFPGSVDIRRSFSDYVDYGQIDVLEYAQTHCARYVSLPLSAEWDLEYPLLHDEALVKVDPILDEEKWPSSEESSSSMSDVGSEASFHHKITVFLDHSHDQRPAYDSGQLQEAKRLQREPLDSAVEYNALNEPPQQLSEVSRAPTSVPGSSKAKAGGMSLLAH